MLGYVVSLADGTEQSVEATHYVVDDDGTLVLYVADDEVGRIGPAAWVEVHQVGRRLTADWPPDDLAWLLDAIGWYLCVGMGNCEPLGPPESYASPLLNEPEAFVTEVLGRIYEDPLLSDLESRRAALRKLVHQHFSGREP